MHIVQQNHSRCTYSSETGLNGNTCCISTGHALENCACDLKAVTLNAYSEIC